MNKITNWFKCGLVMAIISLSACSEKEWDDHYSEQQIDVASSALNIEVVNADMMSYVKNQTEFSNAYAIFEENGLLKTMEQRNQQYTLLICDNDAMATRVIDDYQFFINSSVCNVPMSPASLTTGATLTMWCGKYLKVAVKDEPITTKGSEVEVPMEQNTYIADVKVLKCIKTNNGYIYVMAEPVIALKSLYETFNTLNDTEYSMFKELVRRYEVNEFNKDASEPIGIDKTGNTIYDSVFTIRNSYLDWYTSRFTGTKGSTAKWNMRSEAYTSTMLIPSNEVLKECFDNACKYQTEMIGRKLTAQDTTKFWEWVLRACFYDTELTPEQLSGSTNISGITGYHERHQNWYQALDAAVWNPTIQQVDVANPVKMSNGVAYYVTKMKIPNYYIIWRIKNLAWWTYNACTAEEKEQYYSFVNVRECIQSVNYSFGGWDASTPAVGPGVMRMNVGKDTTYAADGSFTTKDKLNVETSVEWTTLDLSDDHNSVSVQRIPPGEYTLRLGWTSNKQTWTVTAYAGYEGEELVKVNDSPIASTSGHYDREGGGWASYPFEYNHLDYTSIDKNSSKYGRNGGGLIGTITFKGTESKPVRIKEVSFNINDASRPLYLFHWCLCPTENNY